MSSEQKHTEQQNVENKEEKGTISSIKDFIVDKAVEAKDYIKDTVSPSKETREHDGEFKDKAQEKGHELKEDAKEKLTPSEHTKQEAHDVKGDAKTHIKHKAGVEKGPELNANIDERIKEDTSADKTKLNELREREREDNIPSRKV